MIRFWPKSRFVRWSIMTLYFIAVLFLVLVSRHPGETAGLAYSLTGRTLFLRGTAEGREAAAKAAAANGRPVWACYVADLDPADPNADLVADIAVVDGEPQVGVLEGESADRVYTVQGAKKLGGGWSDLVGVDDWDAAGFRFFRIKVDLPAE